MSESRALPSPQGAMIFSALFARAVLDELPERTRDRVVARMDKLAETLIGSPAKVIRVVEPSCVFDEERLVAVAVWAAVKQEARKKRR